MKIPRHLTFLNLTLLLLDRFTVPLGVRLFQTGGIINYLDTVQLWTHGSYKLT